MKKHKHNSSVTTYQSLKKDELLTKLEEILALKDKIISIGSVESLNNIKEFNSGDLTTLNSIEEYKNDIISLNGSISAIKSLEAKKLKLDSIYDKLSILIQIPDDVKSIHQSKIDMCVSVERAKHFYIRSSKSVNLIDEMWNNKIHPDVLKLTALEQSLSKQLAESVAKIEAGHEKALKFLTYRTVIKPCIMSYEEGNYITINDKEKTIYYNIPRPICAVTRPRVTEREIIDACGKCGGGGALLTQEEIDKAVGIGNNGNPNPNGNGNANLTLPAQAEFDAVINND